MGYPFAGRSGKLLNEALATAGIDRGACLVANVFRLQPPDNKVSHFFVSRRQAGRENTSVDEALGPFGTSAYCRALFAGEVSHLHGILRRYNPQAIVALGRTPLWALARRSGLLALRGTLQTCPLLPHVPVVPTFHPSYLMRGRWRDVPLFNADIALAWSLARGATASTDGG